MFFFSSRRRHTRCALVTGVQTCALPISHRRISRYPADDRDRQDHAAGAARAARGRPDRSAPVSITIDYYFSTSSPWTYLGSKRFIDIARKAGATVAVRPVDYNMIFAQSGGQIGRAHV